MPARRSATPRPTATFPLRIGVISDMHVGTHARAVDLCPPHFKTKAVTEDYLGQFEQFVKDQKLHIDALFLPGDITNEAHPAEFSLATNVVERLQRLFKLAPQSIFAVPGNHDVDWAIMNVYKHDYTTYSHKQRYATLRHPGWVFERIFRRGTPHICDEPYYSIWSSTSMIIVGINSASHDTPQDRPHYGLVTDEALMKLDNYCASLATTDSRLRVALFHHHPIAYRDPLPSEPDFSQMTNAPSLLAILRKHRFDLIVHGHKHVPNFRILSENIGHPLVILGAGSFSAMIDGKWAGRVQNHFHIVHVDRRDDSTGNIRGKILSWAYLPVPGWIPSEEMHGIAHVEAFGAHVHPTQVAHTLRTVIQANIAQYGYVNYDMLHQNFPDLDAIPSEPILAIIKTICTELYLDITGLYPHIVLTHKGV